MQHDEHQSSKLKGLAAKKKEITEIQSEANPIGEARYLLPEVAVEIGTGKQVYTTETYCEPDCLRFCPSYSTNQVEISLSGK
jgi:hypothetical protein